MIGYCPQDPVVNENPTIDRHLRYFAAVYRLASPRRADTLVDLLWFGQFRKQTIGALTGGTRQKLNLALALMHDPDGLAPGRDLLEYQTAWFLFCPCTGRAAKTASSAALVDSSVSGHRCPQEPGVVLVLACLRPARTFFASAPEAISTEAKKWRRSS